MITARDYILVQPQPSIATLIDNDSRCTCIKYQDRIYIILVQIGKG